MNSFCLIIALFISSTRAARQCNYAGQEEGHLLCSEKVNTLVIGQNTTANLYTVPTYLSVPVTLNVYVTKVTNVKLQNTIVLKPTDNGSYKLPMHAIRAGTSIIRFRYADNNTNDVIAKVDLVAFKVQVVHWKPLNVVIAVLGWLCFASWTVSFYPQVILNYRLKQVHGLSFEFLVCSLLSYVTYLIYTTGMYWSTGIQREYREQHLAGVIPVHLSDVVFAIHALVLITLITLQCFIYPPGVQRITWKASTFLLGFLAAAGVGLLITIFTSLTWARYFTYLYYGYLLISLVKYIPQFLTNYSNQSTKGWSVHLVQLNLIGNTVSLIQMMLVSYNYNAWRSTFTNPTQFGFDAVAIFIYILFLGQHYILYPGGKRSDYIPLFRINFQLD